MFITAVCVIFLIKLRWPKNKSLYDTVFERYGQTTLKIVRDYEKDLTRFNKTSLDIGFLQKWKLFHIFPTFLNFKLSKEESIQGRFVELRAEPEVFTAPQLPEVL